MNSPSASNGSFCGGNAADLQSKFPKTLSERAKAQGVSRSGISNGITIAFVRKVTFVKNAIKAPCETPLALLAFLFAYHGKQKFDFVEVVFAVRSRITTSLHSAQDDALIKLCTDFTIGVLFQTLACTSPIIGCADSAPLHEVTLPW